MSATVVSGSPEEEASPLAEEEVGVSVVEEVGVSPVVVATAVVEVLAGSPVELPVLGSAMTSSPQAAAARQQEAVRRPVRVCRQNFMPAQYRDLRPVPGHVVWAGWGLTPLERRAGAGLWWGRCTPVPAWRS